MIAQKLQQLLDKHGQEMSNNAYLELSKCSLEIHKELTKDEPNNDDDDDSDVDSWDDMAAPSSERWRQWNLPGLPASTESLLRLTPPNFYEKNSSRQFSRAAARPTKPVRLTFTWRGRSMRILIMALTKTKIPFCGMGMSMLTSTRNLSAISATYTSAIYCSDLDCV